MYLRCRVCLQIQPLTGMKKVLKRARINTLTYEKCECFFFGCVCRVHIALAAPLLMPFVPFGLFRFKQRKNQSSTVQMLSRRHNLVVLKKFSKPRASSISLSQMNRMLKSVLLAPDNFCSFMFFFYLRIEKTRF